MVHENKKEHEAHAGKHSEQAHAADGHSIELQARAHHAEHEHAMHERQPHAHQTRHEHSEHEHHAQHAHHGQKKEEGFPKVYIYFIAILAALLVVAGVFFVWQQQKPVADGGNATPNAIVVKAGDVVAFDYIVRLEDGKVFDTSIKDVAVASGIFVENRSYAPIGAVLQPGASGLVSGVEKALIGMRVGEEKDVTLSPQEAYGQWAKARTVSIPRESRVSRVQTYDLNTLVELSGIPASSLRVGSKVSLSGWPATVVELTNSTVTIMNNPANGQEFSIPSASMLVKISFGDVVRDEVITFRPLVGTILNVTEDEITYLFDTPNTGKYFITDVSAGVTVEARVLSTNSTNIELDYNHPLAGKTLAFNLKVVNATPS